MVSCRRCGTCCLKGGPTLSREDLALMERGALRLSDLYTIRAGELVYHNPDDALITLERELIKIKEREGSKACMFLEPGDNACRIYENRPLQCRTLKCWDTSDLEKLLLAPGLTRFDVLPADLPLRAVIEAHDSHCSPRKARELIKDEPPGVDLEAELGKMVHYDELLRVRIVEQFRIPPGQLDFLFGRPLRILIARLRASQIRSSGSESLK